jgi:hypothetical protein
MSMLVTLNLTRLQFLTEVVLNQHPFLFDWMLHYQHVHVCLSKSYSIATYVPYRSCFESALFFCYRNRLGSATYPSTCDIVIDGLCFT